MKCTTILAILVECECVQVLGGDGFEDNQDHKKEEILRTKCQILTQYVTNLKEKNCIFCKLFFIRMCDFLFWPNMCHNSSFFIFFKERKKNNVPLCQKLLVFKPVLFLLFVHMLF